MVAARFKGGTPSARGEGGKAGASPPPSARTWFGLGGWG